MERADSINSSKNRVSRIVRAITSTFLAACTFVAVSCTSLPTNTQKTISTALKSPPSNGVAGILQREARRHGGKSGFSVIPDNREAFTDRVALARFAEKTIDVQYFIWSADTIGRMLGNELIQAADRGVRVRFLLDDINFKKRDSAAAAFAAHPNIEVRIFNPAQHRSFRRIEFAANFNRLNKRMHNKTLIMDNSCVIIGGRNIADEYFGLGETQNNRDLDIIAVGPIVRDVSNTFDEFWNSIAAVPIETLVKNTSTMEDFRNQVTLLRQQMSPDRYHYPLEADLKSLRTRIDKIQSNLIWAEGRVLYDTTESLKTGDSSQTVMRSLMDEMQEAQKEILLESAYFVVKKPGIELTRSLTSRGVKVRTLTNSLSSNNVLAAQTGHSKNRTALMKAGMDLYELRPNAAEVMRQVAPHGRNSISTLHTKAMVIDEEHTFVGSFNFDPRSANINSEIGILVDSPVFARRVKNFLEIGIQPQNAYHLDFDERGKIRWTTTVDGQPQTWSTDPESSVFRRFKAGAISLLPIQGQL